MSSDIIPLPDLPLLTVFDKLPLPDLFGIHRACPRWNDLQPAAFSRRRTATLLIQPKLQDAMDLAVFSNFSLPFPDQLRQHQDDAEFLWIVSPNLNSASRYETSDFTLEQAKQLCKLKLTSLIVCYIDDGRDVKSVDAILYLLEHFRGKLTALQFFYIYTTGNKMELFLSSKRHANDVARMIKKINTMSALKSLALSIGNSMCEHIKHGFDLPVLKHLERFYFHSNYNPASMLITSLKKYAAKNSALKQLGLMIDMNYEDIQLLVSSKTLARARLLSKITHVSLFGQETPESDLSAIFQVLCVHLPNLSIVEVTFQPNLNRAESPTSLVKLASLAKLSHLSLRSAFSFKLPKQSVTLLQSVPVLIVKVPNRPFDCSLANIHIAFPELRAILLRFNSKLTSMRNLRRLMIPLKKCARLDRIISLDEAIDSPREKMWLRKEF